MGNGGALVVLLITAASFPTAAAASQCQSRAARTVASDHGVSVVSVKADNVVERFYTCGPHGSTHYLGKTGEVRYLGPFVVRGAFVAYAIGDEEPPVSHSLAVMVRNARTGKLVRSWFGPGFGRRGAESGGIGRLALKRNGSVAFSLSWTRVDESAYGIEVRKLDSTGDALLDSGTEIGLRSLALDGSTISWKHGAAVRTAQLE